MFSKFAKLPLRDKILRILAFFFLLGAAANALDILLNARDLHWVKIVQGLVWISMATVTGWGIYKRMPCAWHVGFLFIAFICLSTMVQLWVDWVVVEPKVAWFVPVLGSALFAGLWLTFSILWFRARNYFFQTTGIP
jgi:hypothetical protein